MLHQRELLGRTARLMPPAYKFGQPVKAIYLLMSNGFSYSSGTGDNTNLYYATFHSDTMRLICDESGWDSHRGGWGVWIKAPHLTRNGPNIGQGATGQQQVPGLSPFGHTHLLGGPFSLSAGDRFGNFNWGGQGGNPNISIYDGSTNTIPVNFVNPFAGVLDPTALLTNWGQTFYWNLSPDGRYGYVTTTFTAPGAFWPMFGYPPSVGGIIAEYDLFNQVVSRTWTFGPPWGGPGGDTSTGAYTTGEGCGETNFVTVLKTGGNNAQYSLDRASGTLTQSIGHWGVAGGEVSDGTVSGSGRYVAQGNWGPGTFGPSTSDVYIEDLQTHTLTYHGHQSIPNISGTLGYDYWFGIDDSKIYLQYNTTGVGYPITEVRDPSNGNLLAMTNSYVPQRAGRYYILSNGLWLGLFVYAAGQSGVMIVDPISAILPASLTGTAPSPLNNTSAFWVADDESYFLTVYSESTLGPYDATGERNCWTQQTTAPNRFTIYKTSLTSLPSLPTIGASEYIFAPSGCGPSDIFEMQNVPVLFSTPPLRQYPREVAGLGGTRQRVGRGNPPKAKGYSARQGGKGTYQ
jgi:hypothetical protein